MLGRVWWLALLIALSATPQIAAQEAGRYGTLVDANTRFAFKFFRQSLAKTPDENVLTAPISLSQDFAFLQNGADAEAREEILRAFELDNLSPEEINQQSLALRKALSYPQPLRPAPSSHRSPNGDAPPPVECCQAPPERLVLAGSLWAQPKVAFRATFLERSKKFYSFQTVSVSSRGPAAASAVNAWVSRQTGGALSHVLDSWERDDFLLVDTTWFKGAWIHPFVVSRTHPGDFTLVSGQKKQIPMMAEGGSFAYLRGAKFQAVRMPYHHAAMYVFLPDEDSSLKEFEQSLTADKWAAWIADFERREGYLELPRFRLEYRAPIRTVLEDLGVKRAFTNFASFAPAVSNPAGAALTRVQQAILLSVDETGTEVASATFIGGVIGGIPGGPRPEPFRMIVNRPFFFAICDEQTRAILYMGRIVAP
jgi:serine protease inhibitor